MVCCSECFNDLEIKAVIEIIGRKGNCPLCGFNNAWVYDSDEDSDESEFEELLSSILELYKPEEMLDNDFPEEQKKTIEQHLFEDWNIFATNEEGIREIIKSIINNSIDLDDSLLNQRSGIPELFNSTYLIQNSIISEYTWEEFKKYLRNENRFHSKYINLEILDEVLRDTEVILNKGMSFYRARLADKKGFKRTEMGAPPDDKATPGRANSKGISCLYLSNKRKTTVKEIRAGAFDYVSIATFKLKRDVKILDLSNISHNSPFYAKTDKVKYLINEKHLKKIEYDLAKPLRNSRDNDLDYLPTQYISDFAKFKGYDGVKYMSTFDKSSYNIAIFDPDVCECVYHRNYLIGDLDYKLSAL